MDRLPGKTRFRQVTFGKARPCDGGVAEPGADAGKRTVRRRKVPRRPLDEEPFLHGCGSNRSPGDAKVDDAPLERNRLETQADQRHQLRDVQRRRGGTDHLGPDSARQKFRAGETSIEPEVQRQLGQHLAPFGSSSEQTIDQALGGKQQTSNVTLRLIEIVPCEQRLR